MNNTFDDFFRIFGGTAALARVLGSKVSTTGEMKRRGTIPPEYWRILISAAQARGINLTVDDLLDAYILAKYRRPPRAPSPTSSSRQPETADAA